VNVPPEASQTPETRILEALKELRASAAPSAELDGIKDRLEQVAEEAGNATIGFRLAREDIDNTLARVTALENKTPKEVTLIMPDLSKRDAGVQHRLFPRLLAMLACRINAFLVGPAGSGKTRAAEECAKVLQLPFYAMSFGKQSPQSQIFGFVDATGTYRRSLFREAYENGGIFLADEIDAANDNTITSINAATSNDICGFPDGMVKKHADFIMLAAGNTYGRGADRQYVGRTQLDAATLDRFAVLNWDIDEELENAITSNRAWVTRVQQLRANAAKNNVRIVITPRASLKGERFLAAGISQAEVEEMVIWKGIDKATREKIEQRV
jgi:MoxR-like ATPase